MSQQPIIALYLEGLDVLRLVWAFIYFNTLCLQARNEDSGNVEINLQKFKALELFAYWTSQGDDSFVDPFCYLCFVS